MKKPVIFFSLLTAAALLTACGSDKTYQDATGYLASDSSTVTAAQSTPSSAAGTAGAAGISSSTGTAGLSGSDASAAAAASVSDDFTSYITIVPSSSPAASAGATSAQGAATTSGNTAGTSAAGASATGASGTASFSGAPGGDTIPVSVSTPLPINSAASTTASTAAPVSATAQPTPIPTATPAQNLVTITKSPTSETVTEGGSAMFIAYAENYTGIVWITVSPDKQTSYEIGDAAKVFTGLVVSGQGTSVLSLNNIPASMNGWRIQAYFTGNGGPAYTSGAYLTVTSASAALSPVITSAPSSGTVVIDTAEQSCVTLANQAYAALNSKAASYGYTVSAIQNYAYANTIADFNITFSNSSYSIVGEFKSYYYSASNNGYGPVRVVVYNNGTEWLSMNLTDKTIDYFYNILYEYRA